ncbi:hypothetical protein JCM10207_005106 [Rhodosporidiobolus poonsookiae]
MPFKRIDYRDLEMFYVLNPDPRQMASATHDNLPASNPLKPGLPILVFIHAAGANVTSWTRQMGDPRLASQFNLFAMDCRFHGFTKGGDRKDHTLKNSAECVMATLDEMEFPSYSLYGEGVHGCNVASWIASMRPEKVSCLLLASPGYQSEPAHVVELLQGVQDELLVNKDGRGDASGTLPSDALADVAAYFIGGSERLASHRQVMQANFQKRYGTGQTGHDIGWLFRAVYERKPLPPTELAKIHCPVLILRGAEDKIVSPEVACEGWAKSFVNAKGPVAIHAVASAPGLLSLSDSNLLNRFILQFVQRSMAGK